MDTISKSYNTTEEYRLNRRKLWTYRYRGEYKRRIGEQIIIHRYKKAADKLYDMIEDGKFENSFKNSDLSDLAIVTVHNYDYKTLLEQSLDFLGIKDYTVFNHTGKWRMAYKYIYLLEFIEECNKPYILFCDARDSIFIDDPAKIIPFFKEFECEALFNSSYSPRGIFKSYESAAGIYWWTRKVAKTGWTKKYPNAGGFIGKSQLIKEIAEVILFYCEHMGCKRYPTSDQDVLRAIYPWFWPRMKVDNYNRIFYRN